MKSLITVLIVSIFLSSSTFALAKDDSIESPSKCEVIGDVSWVRPFGFVHVGLGAVAYVISLPVTIPLNKKEEAKEFLITFPYNYYIKRPLGEM